uniref:Uncharacterized protein n=1 Tax=Arundo donax TaxID=35708 RepID=A0A0A9F215_ARUDO
MYCWFSFPSAATSRMRLCTIINTLWLLLLGQI